jgi:type IV secretory pathway VirB2 component (pilin)
MFNFIKRLFKHCCTAFSTLLLPALAYADNGDTPISQGLSYVTGAMFGTTGITLATIAIIGVGLLCLFHVLQWTRFLQTIAGIAIVFGAGGIVSAVKALIPNQ